MAKSPLGNCADLYPAPRTIRAMEQIRKMRGGSQSHMMRCSDGHNHDLYYIVKFQNNPQGRRILVNELLGTRLASLMGLPTSPTAVVDVEKDLIDYTPVLAMELPRHRVPCHAGPQFGSSYPGNPRLLTLYDFVPDQQLREVLNLQDFAGMLVFDKWTCNTDGRQVIFVRVAPRIYNVVMIDNGFCFNAAEWNFPDAPLRALYALPYAYEAVLGIHTFEPWLQLLETTIDRQWLAEAADEIPREWYAQATTPLAALLDKLERRRTSVGELLRSACAGSPRHFRNWAGRPGSICFERGDSELERLRAKAARAASADSQASAGLDFIVRIT